MFALIVVSRLREQTALLTKYDEDTTNKSSYMARFFFNNERKDVLIKKSSRKRADHHSHNSRGIFLARIRQKLVNTRQNISANICRGVF